MKFSIITLFTILFFLPGMNANAKKGPTYKDLVLQYVECRKASKEFAIFDISQEDLEKSCYDYFRRIERETGRSIMESEKRSMSKRIAVEYFKKKKDSDVFNIVRSAFKENITEEQLKAILDLMQTEEARVALDRYEKAQYFRLDDCMVPIGEMRAKGMTIEQAVAEAPDIKPLACSESYEAKFEKYYSGENEQAYVTVLVEHYTELLQYHSEDKMHKLLGKNVDKMIPYLQRNDKMALRNSFIKYVSEKQLDILLDLSFRPEFAGIQKVSQKLSNKVDFNHKEFWERISKFVWEKLIRKYMSENPVVPSNGSINVPV